MGGAMARPGPARTRSESRRRTALVALRLLPNERDKLAEAARSRGITLSEFIRSSALQAVDSQLKPGTHGTDAPASQDVVQNVSFRTTVNDRTHSTRHRHRRQMSGEQV